MIGHLIRVDYKDRITDSQVIVVVGRDFIRIAVIYQNHEINVRVGGFRGFGIRHAIVARTFHRYDRKRISTIPQYFNRLQKLVHNYHFIVILTSAIFSLNNHI